MTQLELQYIAQRIKNLTGTAEGTLLPPRQIGPLRVPTVSGLTLVKTENSFNQNIFTLVWNNPEAPNISHYAIYVSNSINQNAVPLGPFETKASPAQVSIPAVQLSRPIFIVQTVMKNGIVSNLNDSPSCVGLAAAGV